MKIHFFVGFLLSLLFLFGLCKVPTKGITPPDPAQIPELVIFPFHTKMIDTSWEMPALPPIRVGAAQLEHYQAQIHGKRLGLVVNQSSLIDQTHLVDSLLRLGMDIRVLFAPEHGFRGDEDAGATVADGVDSQTGLPVISLYGKTKKPSPADLQNLDMVIFDIQDVGARFFTYLSTLHYVMEACAENNIPLLLLDRPNPNAHYIDGPVLKPGFSSFVGMHPVPVVYGMTIGEYAQMINGEGWLKRGIQCKLEVIPLAWYNHDRPYELPVRPSPNLPNQRAIYLYPSLCFFEGTEINAGRGTGIPFQCYGAPALLQGTFHYIPLPNPGARYPKHQGKECVGTDLSDLALPDLFAQQQLNLSYLLNAYTFYASADAFFLSTGFFDLLAGTDQLRLQIRRGAGEAEIRSSWQADLDNFKAIRKRYLLY
ncbi:MAG: DUF1343 domain-containing protein [Saprospiraceae bacterium]|nr:DUF1343 domain-containing protein [Saprospiraceae bacterium]